MGHTLHFINQIHKLGGMNEVSTKDTFWVLSVPAIWDEMSKEMMKPCARDAGMAHMELGSEPIMSTFHVLNEHWKDFPLKQNDNFLVLDCGGGTIDAACIKIVSKNMDLRELHHGEGIRTDGLDVDEKFLGLLGELLPKEIIGMLLRHTPSHHRHRLPSTQILSRRSSRRSGCVRSRSS